MLIEKGNAGPGTLVGQVVVITGAGGGIGRETALALAYLGASIGIAEVRESGSETAEAIQARGGKALFVQTDVSDPGSYGRFRDRVEAELGPVDVLINNAEAVVIKPTLEHTLIDWERVFAVNVRGAFLGIQLFLPGMLQRRRGTIVFMPTAQGTPYMSAYAASKAALESLSQSLAQELKPDSGLSVFTFGAPVMVETPATRMAVPALAERYGISDADFIAMATGGRGMMAAELCATGLAGAVVHAPEFAGRETSSGVGLARLGLSESGERIAASAEPPAPHAGVAPPGQTRGDVLGRATAVEDVIGRLRADFDSLGVFQRQWYRRSITRNTGLDLDGWARAAQESVSRLRQGQAVDPHLVDQLQRLSALFTKEETDYSAYVSDPAKLDEGLAELRRRRATVDALVEALTPVVAPG